MIVRCSGLHWCNAATEIGPGLFHRRVAVPPAFHNARFESSRSVGDLVWSSAAPAAVVRYRSASARSRSPGYDGQVDKPSNKSPTPRAFRESASSYRQGLGIATKSTPDYKKSKISSGSPGLISAIISARECHSYLAPKDAGSLSLGIKRTSAGACRSDPCAWTEHGSGDGNTVDWITL